MIRFSDQFDDEDEDDDDDDYIFAAFMMPTDSQWGAYIRAHGETPLRGSQERELEEWWSGQMQDNFLRCSASQSGGTLQANTSKAPVDDHPPEMEQPLAAAHDSEEMEVQDRDSEQVSAEVPRPTGSQCSRQSIETHEAPPCN
ncbi:hypothetical protein E2320_007007 [Naja naja]|nr:hypothetical protein E2320_007007 [Naja naja]